MTTQAHGTTYLYVTPDGQRREIGVIRGLGDSWIVGWSAGGAHHRVKTPRLPAGSDPAALQALLDTWAAERGLPVATPDAAAPAPAASAPAVSERQRSEASSRPAAAERQPSEALTTILAAGEDVQRTITSLLQIGTDPSLIPADWETQAALIDTAVAMGQRLTLVLAMIVARASDTFADPSDWLRACMDRWGWQKAHVHHLRAVGSLLIRECGSATHECGNATLMSLHVDKLLAISRLPADQVARFLERERPQDCTRDEVRTAVNLWLSHGGEPPADAATATPEPEAPPPPAPHPAGPAVQQDFLDTLFAAALDDASRRAMADDDTPAKKAAVGGLVLIDVAVTKLSREDTPDLTDMETLLTDLGGQETRLREVIERTLRRAGPPPAAPVLLQPADHQEF